MLEPFERFVGRAGAPLTAVGGGAQSDLWCQIIADVTGRAIRQPEAPIQANAMGAAFIAAVGLGALSFDDVPALMRWRRVYEPQSDTRALYDERFACVQGRSPAARAALPPPQPAAGGRAMIAEREREIVVALCRELAARGFLAATGGNLALRIDAAHFAVTPSALDYAVMTAADVCMLDLADLTPVDGDARLGRERAARRRAEAPARLRLLDPHPPAGCQRLRADRRAADNRRSAAARDPRRARAGRRLRAVRHRLARRQGRGGAASRRPRLPDAQPRRTVLRRRSRARPRARRALEAACLAHLRARIAAGRPERRRPRRAFSDSSRERRRIAS